MNENFKIGDKVYAGYGTKCDFYGEIIAIEDNVYIIEFSTSSGGGCLPFVKSNLCRGCNGTKTCWKGN